MKIKIIHKQKQDNYNNVMLMVEENKVASIRLLEVCNSDNLINTLNHYNNLIKSFDENYYSNSNTSNVANHIIKIISTVEKDESQRYAISNKN